MYPLMGAPERESTRGPIQRGPVARYPRKITPPNTGASHQYLRNRACPLLFFFLLWAGTAIGWVFATISILRIPGAARARPVPKGKRGTKRYSEAGAGDTLHSRDCRGCGRAEEEKGGDHSDSATPQRAARGQPHPRRRSADGGRAGGAGGYGRRQEGSESRWRHLHPRRARGE